MDQPLASACRFETERLVVGPWHELVENDDLAAMVTPMLTESVTRALPEDWRGEFSLDRTQRWIAERDAESPTLLVLDKTANTPVGLVLLFESTTELDGTDFRVGYLLDEMHWGQGFASEIVAGLVTWARMLPEQVTLRAGVETGHQASARVLAKNGFELSVSEGATDLYCLRTSEPA
ncbi:MAG: GNAT family N-acetyltransferase [Acidimicrobiia bacterium]|nr:GNAT family N-acetyltransferase [Acidimicrobiia bacterium]